jgi:magnesium transporter
LRDWEHTSGSIPSYWNITNTTERPKLEEYDNYIFVTLKLPYMHEDKEEVSLQQVSLIVGADYVVTCAERPSELLADLQDKIKTGQGRLRRMGSDYLAYLIIDVIVDYYFSVLEKLGERIEVLEEQLMVRVDQHILNHIYQLKQELVVIRRSVWPMREVVSNLQRAEHPVIGKSTGVYLRDVYDHTVQVVETIETFRDMTSGMLDLYLSTMSNKMNEIMKVLTIFSAIFIPLTFFAGVYGMNFDHMPELRWQWGYGLFWVVMISLTAMMVMSFKKKKWM